MPAVDSALTMIGTLASLPRSSHRPDHKQTELRMPEAVIATQVVGAYGLLLMIFLP